MAFLRALSLYMVAALPLALAAAVEPAPTLTIAPGLELPYVSLGTGSGQKGDVENATAIWLGPGLDGAGVAIDTAYNYFGG